MLRKLLNSVLSTDLKAVHSLAKDRIRARLRVRVRVPHSQVLEEAGLDPAWLRAGATLLADLETIMGVPEGVIRSNDTLEDLLTVNVSELTKDAAAVLKKHGTENAVEEFGYEVLRSLSTRSDPDLWEAQRITLDQHPRSEDEWIDVILSMTVAHYLQFFAPMVRLS